MIDVDDEVARGQPLEDVPRHDPAHRLRPADADVPEELAIGDEDQSFWAAGEAAVQAPIDHGHRAGRGRTVDGVGHARGMPSLFEQLGETWRLVGGDDDARLRAVVGAPALDRVRDPRTPTKWQLRFAPPEQVAR